MLKFLLLCMPIVLVSCNERTTTEPGNYFYAVEFLGDRFVAVGADELEHALIATSDDGMQWVVEHRDAEASTLSGVAMGTNETIAVGRHFVIGPDGTQENRVRVLARESNGWRALDFPAGLEPEDIAFGNGTFVVVGGSAGGTFSATSIDGSEWDVTEYGIHLWLGAKVDFVDGRFIAYGDGPSLAESVQGTQWSFYDLGVTLTRRVTSLNGSVVGSAFYDCCYGEAGTQMEIQLTRVDDGWTAEVIAGAPSLLSIAAGDGVALASSHDGLHQLVDLERWQWLDLNESQLRFGSLAHGNGVFVTAAADLFSSVDGSDWVTTTPPRE